MKRALESKIMEISHEKNLDLRALEAPVGDSKNGGMMGGRSLSDLLSSSLVLGAIVLKKSPVPGKCYYLHHQPLLLLNNKRVPFLKHMVHIKITCMLYHRHVLLCCWLCKSGA